MPALSKVSNATYAALAVSVPDSLNTQAVLSRVAARPTFPPQVALVGQLSSRFILAQPITVNFEEEEGGKIIASDDVFYMYGQGFTRQEALSDYVSSLSEYYEVLESQDSQPSIELFQYLQSYLQPI